MAEPLDQEARYEIYLEEKARLEARERLSREKWEAIETTPTYRSLVHASDTIMKVVRYGMITIILAVVGLLGLGGILQLFGWG